MDFKKNILTRVLAAICLAGLIFGIMWALSIDKDAEFAVLGVGLIMFWVGVPVVIVGFTQIIISAIRWRRLTIFDKIISVPIALVLLFLISIISYYFLTDTIYGHQDPKKVAQALEQNNPNLCGQIKLEKNWKMKEDCYDALALKRQDPSICGSVECFEEFALILKDPFLCTGIKKLTNHRWTDADNCYIKTLDKFWESIEDKKDVCGLIEYDFDREKCFSKIESEK